MLIPISGFTENEIRYYVNKYGKDFIDYEQFDKQPQEGLERWT